MPRRTRARRRRALVPAVLLVVASTGGAVALWPGGADSPASRAVRHADAPVLSLRRAAPVLRDRVAAARLRSSLDGLLADPALGAARTSTCLVVGVGDRELYARDPDRPLIPASNLKILTAVAALRALGPDSRMRTEVRAEVGADGVVTGDMWLVGGGDPLLMTGDYVASLPRPPGPYTPLEELARRVRAAGVSRVDGSVVGDESRFDRQRSIPTWRPNYLTDNEVGPLSALAVNDGFEAFRPTRIRSARPATHAAAVFTALLRAQGVVVTGVPSEAAASAVPVVASVESPPVAEVVGQMLRESDNTTAELLVKELAHDAGTRPASTPAGLRALREALTALALPGAGALHAVDGSGLDRADRASCRLLRDVLGSAQTADALAAGLPVAGRTGTLDRRFTGSTAVGRVRAKTGSLDGVAALSGFADAAGGSLSFALILNGLPRDSLGPVMWTRVAESLLRWPEAPPLAVLEPGGGT